MAKVLAVVAQACSDFDLALTLYSRVWQCETEKAQKTNNFEPQMRVCLRSEIKKIF